MSRYVKVNDVMNLINTSNRGNCDYFIVDQIEELCMSEKTIGEQQVRAKAIDEFAERITKRLKEEVALLEQERTEAREYDDEQIIFATSNQLRAFDYGLRVIAEEMRGVQ